MRPASLLSGTHGMTASVDDDADAGREGSLVGGQEGDGVGDFFRLAGTAESMSFLAPFKELKGDKQRENSNSVARLGRENHLNKCQS